MDSCNETGFCPLIDGFTADVVHELAKMYNFTWTVTKFSSDDWGTSPISGKWGDPNATFGGVFGKVFFTYLMISTFHLFSGAPCSCGFFHQYTELLWMDPAQSTLTGEIS